MKKISCAVAALLVALGAASCSKDSPVEKKPIVNTYPVPLKTDDGWDTASLADVGIDEAPLLEMIKLIDTTANHQVHNILIIKNKKLVFEEYFSARSYTSSPPGLGSSIIAYDMDMLHYWASVSKSVTSVLYGIAIEKGLVSPDVNEKIINYFPDYTSTLTGAKADLSVKNLLTMTSGLDFDETTFPYGDSRNDVTRLFSTGDPIRFVLSKNLHATPGTVFHYNSGATNVIADIIRRKSGQNLLQFAETNLFGPLGITKYQWQKLSGNYYFASGGLSLRPRDMAKIGLLFLNKGRWNGIPIISEQWINESTQGYSVPTFPFSTFATGYGYQWWLNSVNSGGRVISYIQAAGYGEQLMFILPAVDLILVFNCGYFNVPATISPYQLINDFIARAVLIN